MTEITGRRWTSRKFLLAMVGQIVGILVLLAPENESAIVEAANHISALVLMALSGVGYIHGEAKIDAEVATRREEAKIANGTAVRLLNESMGDIQVLRNQVKQSGGTPAAALVLAALLFFAAAGCDTIGGMHTLDDDGVRSMGQPGSSSRMTADGNQSSNLIGTHPTVIKSDNDGIWKNTGGPTRTLTLVPATGQIFTDSTDDLAIARFTYTPMPREGEPQLVIEGLSSGQSAVVEQFNVGLSHALATLQGMTREQATVTIERWKQIGSITDSVADAVMAALFPPSALSEIVEESGEGDSE